MTGRHRPAPRNAAVHARSRTHRRGNDAMPQRGHRRPHARPDALVAAGDMWGEALRLSLGSLRRMPRPVVVPLVAVAVLAVAFTAAAAPGGNSAAPLAAPQWPYTNWVIPTVSPDLEASATIVDSEPAKTEAPTTKKPANRTSKKTPAVKARTYNAVPAALAASGIPAPAMRAYKRSAAWAASNDRACGLRWELLAAIGRVESGHGTTGDSVMTWSGAAVPGIYGPVLDGKGPFALIRDTENGALDRDKRYDRAVGPMQFLPASWKVVGRDGDGDGKVRVQDIDDAAAGAAVYLCAGKLNTSTAEGLRANIFRYNRSESYVNLVIGVMEQYGANVPKIVPAEKAPPKKTSPKKKSSDGKAGSPGTSEPSPRATSPKPTPKPSTSASPKPSPTTPPATNQPPTSPPATTAPPADPAVAVP